LAHANSQLTLGKSLHFVILSRVVIVRDEK